MPHPKALSILPCCENFTRIAGEYTDLCADTDSPMRMLATLLLCTENTDLLDIHVLRELGHTLETFINKQAVHQHLFFGRSLHSCTLNDADLGAELGRVRRKLKQAIGL